MADVALHSLTRYFGQTLAVDDLELTCRDGELFVLLGPSGAGKTTTLKMVAGLVEPSAGRVVIGGRDVTQMEPGDRDVAMAFETYALYPHLSVYDNLAFPLRSPRAKGKLDRTAIDGRVRSIAQLLQIDALLERTPTQLSGGQKQRVALGRALVREPSLFLLDEPIAHLDAKLRNRMHGELKRIQQRFGTTMIYATPDHAEAMAMADRLAVIDHGRLVQVGAPLDVYHAPANEFVARFLSDPPMNLISSQVVASDGRLVVRFGGLQVDVDGPLGVQLAAANSQNVHVGVRPTDVAVSMQQNLLGAEAIQAEVLVTERAERTVVGMLRLDGVDLKVRVPAETGLRPGEAAYVRFDPTTFLLFDATTGNALR
jgi:multiple sugar transport system ATP-binding protein